MTWKRRSVYLSAREAHSELQVSPDSLWLCRDAPRPVNLDTFTVEPPF